MIHRKNLPLVALLGLGVVVTGLALHSHIQRVRAARLEHVVPPAPYFPPGSVWTQDISHAPLDPHSSRTIDWLANAGGWGMGKVQVDFSMRVLQASANTPTAPIQKGSDWITPDSDYVSRIPLPVGGGFEGHTDYSCPEHGDCHLIVVDRSQGKLYETWATNYVNNTLSASFLAIWDLNRVYPQSGRGDQCSSADAAGFPIAPLLFTADELATGSINHAIRFILPAQRIRTRVFVHPATHAGGPSGPASAPPYGAHFRLKASYDLSQLSPPAQVVARAMQRYGMFLADQGNVALTAQSDQDTTAKYADLGFDSHDLRALKVTDFEVVDSGTPIPQTNDCDRNP